MTSLCPLSHLESATDRRTGDSPKSNKTSPPTPTLPVRRAHASYRPPFCPMPSDCVARSSPFVRSCQKRDQFLNRDNTSAVIKRVLLPQFIRRPGPESPPYLK